MAIAVLDVGKSNAKLLLLDEAGEVLAQRSRACAVLPGPPYPQLDLDGIWRWAVAALRELAALAPIRCIVPVAHGAAAVLMAGEAPALPALDYEHPAPDACAGELAAQLDPFALTGSPILPLGMCLGAQLHWQERSFPDAFARASDLLLLPQYWAWRLSGVKATEVTSLGAHTHLWRPAEGAFSGLVERRGWARLFPPMRRAWETLGPVQAGGGGRHRPAARLPGGRGHPRQQCLLPAAPRRPCRPHSPCSPPAPGSSPWRPAPESTGSTRRPTCWPMSTRMGSRCRRPGSWAGARSSWWPAPMRCTPRRRRGCRGDRGGGRDGAAELRRRQRAVHGPAGPHRRRSRVLLRPGGPPWRALYAALTVDAMLDKLGATGPVIVEGSFHRNAAFCGLLAALRPGQPIHATDDPSGTARGAWLLARWDERPNWPNALAAPVTPWPVTGLAAYRTCWLHLTRGANPA